MKKVPIPPEVAEELLRILFEEIAKDGVVDEQERLLFFSFASRLSINKERFNVIRKEVQKNLKLVSGAGRADLKTLKARVSDCLSTHLSISQHRDFAALLLEILQSAFLSAAKTVAAPSQPTVEVPIFVQVKSAERAGIAEKIGKTERVKKAEATKIVKTAKTAEKSKKIEKSEKAEKTKKPERNEQKKDEPSGSYMGSLSLPSIERLSGLSSDLDAEYMDILVDISQMELDTELEDFRKRLICEKAKIEQLKKKNISGLDGLIVGSIVGVLVSAGIFAFSLEESAFFTMFRVIMPPFSIFFLYKYLVFLQKFSGYAILPHTPAQIKLALGLLFSVPVILFSPLSLFFMFLVMCGTLGAYMGENKALMEENALCRVFEQENANYALEPRDVLRFWNIRLQNYIRERIKIVQFRSTEAKNGIEKSLGLIDDMKEMGVQERDNRIKTLYLRITKLEKLQLDSEKVLLILAEVENGFIRIIEELRSLCEKQARIDAGDYAEDVLQMRYKNLLGETDSCLQQWEGEKRDIAIDLASLMQNFRREFLNAKDFVKAQLELAKRD